ncbi:MAG: hypothetical protein D6772_14075, partial [Bacteroidetes bacterium]
MQRKKGNPKKEITRWFHFLLCFSMLVLGTTTTQAQTAVRSYPKKTDETAPLRVAKRWISQHQDQLVYQASSFRWQEPTTDIAGQIHLTAQQYYGEIPVFDGFVRFHFGADGNIQRVQEHLLPLTDIPTEPLLSADQLLGRALAALRECYPWLDPQKWQLRSTELVVLHPQIIRAQAARQGFLAYAQHWEHHSGSAGTLYWDSQTGKLLAYLQNHCELFRHQLYEGRSFRPIWNNSQEIPADFDQWKRWQISATQQTYNLFYSAFGRNSYDGQGASYRSRANAELSNCPNARWTGTEAQFCPGVSSDDVVAHEWGHAYTQYTSELTYAWQSGAINEAYSDIWGEVVDLLNTEGNDQGEELVRTACDDDGLRWKIAEDATVINGPIRDLWAPNCHADPASIDDPYYDCDPDESDAGGVHSNSGLVNRTFARLVDGDGSQAGLGLTKAAHLFWHAQAHYLSRTSDFRTLAAALKAAYTDLQGLDLPQLRLSDTLRQASGERLQYADSLWLAQVLLQAGLERELTHCPNYAPLLSQNAPAICLDGYAEHIIFSEDFEQGWPGWQATAEARFPAQWQTRHWMLADFLPAGKSGQALFAPVPNNGPRDPNQCGLLRIESPTIYLPPGLASPFQLRFRHYIALEPGDGGRLSYRR